MFLCARVCLFCRRPLSRRHGGGDPTIQSFHACISVQPGTATTEPMNVYAPTMAFHHLFQSKLNKNEHSHFAHRPPSGLFPSTQQSAGRPVYGMNISLFYNSTTTQENVWFQIAAQSFHCPASPIVGVSLRRCIFRFVGRQTKQFIFSFAN